MRRTEHRLGRSILACFSFRVSVAAADSHQSIQTSTSAACEAGKTLPALMAACNGLRDTGKAVLLPIGLRVEPAGIYLKFTQELDKKVAEDVKHYQLEQWNYRWSGEYGSRHWSVIDTNLKAHDPVPVAKATLSEDRREVFLKIANLKPVMQMRVKYELQTANGMKMDGKLWNTVNFTK